MTYFKEHKEYWWYGRHIPKYLVYLGEVVMSRHSYYFKKDKFEPDFVRQILDNVYIYRFTGKAGTEVFVVVNTECRLSKTDDAVCSEIAIVKEWFFDKNRYAEELVEEKFNVTFPLDYEIIGLEDETEEERFKFLRTVFRRWPEDEVRQLVKEQMAK